MTVRHPPTNVHDLRGDAMDHTSGPRHARSDVRRSRSWKTARLVLAGCALAALFWGLGRWRARRALPGT